jgi:hypothetical protein
MQHFNHTLSILNPNRISGMNNLYQIIYVSTAKTLLDETQLIELLAQARSNNKKHNITGMLLYKEGSFMQALEGELKEVTQLFVNILNDPSHSGIIELVNEPISKRDFPDWEMGFRNIPSGAIDGFTDFFNKKYSDKIAPGKAKLLLSNFKNT